MPSASMHVLRPRPRRWKFSFSLPEANRHAASPEPTAADFVERCSSTFCLHARQQRFDKRCTRGDSIEAISGLIENQLTQICVVFFDKQKRRGARKCFYSGRARAERTIAQDRPVLWR
jgi:hypothetical protein